jgi:hypothetical protein
MTVPLPIIRDQVAVRRDIRAELFHRFDQLRWATANVWVRTVVTLNVSSTGRKSFNAATVIPYEPSEAHFVSIKSSSGAVGSDTSAASGLNDDAVCYNEHRQCRKRGLFKVMVPKRVRKVSV